MSIQHLIKTGGGSIIPNKFGGMETVGQLPKDYTKSIYTAADYNLWWLDGGDYILSRAMNGNNTESDFFKYQISTNTFTKVNGMPTYASDGNYSDIEMTKDHIAFMSKNDGTNGHTFTVLDWAGTVLMSVPTTIKVVDGSISLTYKNVNGVHTLFIAAITAALDITVYKYEGATGTLAKSATFTTTYTNLGYLPSVALYGNHLYVQTSGQSGSTYFNQVTKVDITSTTWAVTWAYEHTGGRYFYHRFNVSADGVFVPIPYGFVRIGHDGTVLSNKNVKGIAYGTNKELHTIFFNDKIYASFDTVNDDNQPAIVKFDKDANIMDIKTLPHSFVNNTLMLDENTVITAFGKDIQKFKL